MILAVSLIKNVTGLTDIQLTDQNLDPNHPILVTVEVKNGNVSTNGNYNCSVSVNKTTTTLTRTIKLSSYTKTSLTGNLMKKSFLNFQTD